MPSLPRKFARYEVERELGKGAMGVVFLGRDPVIGRRVALKTIRAGGEDDSETREFTERFLREAQAAGTLSHPNIVTIHDVGEEVETGTSFIAMEYVEGKNLKQLLKDKVSFSYDRIAEIVTNVGDALDYAHRRGIVHRDVKPANIILTNDGTVKITDFGIAKINSSSLTATGQFLGTPNYMSPEQVTGEAVDGRSDLFSLGVVLYELLTKKKPFAGDNLTSISYKIVHEEYPSPQTYDAAIPAEFNPILARALAKDPAARFQSGKDFVQALSEFRARNAEMEMLKDLGEMVAQAERLGPVSAVESQESRPSAASKTPNPSGPLARPAAPSLFGGGNTTLEDLARRGRSDLDPSLAAIPNPSQGMGGPGPDWSLDTDALKPSAVKAREEDEAHETPPSSPGTLVSDVQRGVKPATDRDSGRIRPPGRPAEPSAAPVVKEGAGDPLSQLTERIQTIPPPAGRAPKEPIREAPPPVTVLPSPLARTLPPSQTPSSVVPLPAGGESQPPVSPMRPPTRTGAPAQAAGPPASTFSRPVPPVPPPDSPGGAPRVAKTGRDITGPIPPMRPAAGPAGPLVRPLAGRPAASATRAPGSDVTGPVSTLPPRSPATAAGAAPPGGATAAERLPDVLKREVNHRFVYLTVGVAVLIAAIVLGLLAQRSCAVAGKAPDESVERDTLARKKLLEDGTRALAEGRPAEARAAFIDLLRQAPDSTAARAALEKAEAALAKKDDQDRRVAEAGARLAVAREAREAKDFPRVVVEADAILALVPDSAEARELKEAALAELATKGRAAQKKAADQIRSMKAAARPAVQPTAAPEPVVVAPRVETPAPPAGPTPARVRLRIAVTVPAPQGYVMVRRNDVEVFRRTFDFGRKSGGGSLDGEIEVPSGPAEFKAWVIATDRSVNQYKVVPLTLSGDGRTLALDVDASKNLTIALR
ncbi:MAG TPA: protein kinase [Thermoanaerobaculia bacterium]